MIFPGDTLPSLHLDYNSLIQIPLSCLYSCEVLSSLLSKVPNIFITYTNYPAVTYRIFINCAYLNSCRISVELTTVNDMFSNF